jgi:hypothetical protein
VSHIVGSAKNSSSYGAMSWTPRWTVHWRPQHLEQITRMQEPLGKSLGWHESVRKQKGDKDESDHFTKAGLFEWTIY